MYLKKKHYLCTMFEKCRKYASVMLVVMMSLFAVALAFDEYGDDLRAMADLQTETCVELQSVDMEWDEDGTDNGDGQLCMNSALCVANDLTAAGQSRHEHSAALQSDKQRRGLVRRYAPRKNIGANYILLT